MNVTPLSSWLTKQLSRDAGEFTIRFQHRHALPRTRSRKTAPRPITPPGTVTALEPQWTLKILESIREIDAQQWDSVIGSDNLLKSHAYLCAIESASVDNCTYYYPTLRDARGQLIAHACVYVIDTDLAQLLPKTLSWPTRLIRKIWPRFLVVKITECAAPLSTSHSFSFDRNLNHEQQIVRLADAVDDIAQRERSRLIVVRDFMTDERRDFDVLRSMGYNVVSNMPLARIRVRWSTYAEYLSAMRARYRKDVKRRLRRAEAAGQSTRILESFGDRALLWANQAHTVQEKTKGFKREILPAGYYAGIDRYLGSSSVLVTAERDGLTVAHGMLLQDSSTTIATYFGRDRGAAHQEWFQLVNEVIRIGIENKSRYINLGLGSYDAKMNVGADLEPLYVYSKSTIGAVNWLMRKIPKTMDRTTVTTKQVFRSQKRTQA